MSSKSRIRGLPIGIGTTFDYSVPFEPMCRMIAQAGFKAITIGGGNVEHSGYDTEPGRTRIREIAARFGLEVDSVHAPFGAQCDLSVPDIQGLAATKAEKVDSPTPPAKVVEPTFESTPREPASALLSAKETSLDRPAPAQAGTSREAAPDASDEPPLVQTSVPVPPRLVAKPSPERLDAVVRGKNAIDATMALGSQIVIIHPTREFESIEMRGRIRALSDSLTELIPYARHRNVRLALENLTSLLAMQVFEAALDEFPELGICYDSSHAQISTNPFSILQRFRDRIIATHISDNRGKNDDHMLPFEGIIDWDEFAFYAGKLENLHIFTLEVEVRESSFKDTVEFLNQAAQRARRLQEM